MIYNTSAISQKSFAKELKEGEKSDFKKNMTFAFCFLIITTQYLFFTMPLAFLVNELINVSIVQYTST